MKPKPESNRHIRRLRKAKMIPFRFRKPIEKYLRRESRREGKTMLRIIEEMLEYRAQFRTWPPRIMNPSLPMPESNDPSPLNN